VVSPRYASPVGMRCIVPAAAVLASPDGVQVSELLQGEAFAVFDHAGAWAWGQGASDNYVGWVRTAALALGGDRPNSRITAPQALVFAGPSIKATVLSTLPLGAAVSTTSEDITFLRSDAGWIHRRHVAALQGDAVALAHGFVGTPYHWGGRTRSGVDCSGLVQAVLMAHGIACPRDSDQQRDAFATVDNARRRRGDLVFVPGHVGILVDAETLLHANAHWMATVVEPLADVLARLGSSDFDVRRPL
jgi:cell wall-associated NlpC family hydrolase